MANEKLREAFDGADNNGDGYVTVDELIAYANSDPLGYQALFIALQRGDTNHDRKLSFEELVAYVESVRK